jgi:hypothetical protein
VSFASSAIRNLVRIVDMQPVITYGVGITSILASKQGKTLAFPPKGIDRFVPQVAKGEWKP